MTWWGKGVGAAFGWLAGGPWGAALGFLLGNSADLGSVPGRRRAPERLFMTGWLSPLFGMLGCLARADGRVSETEVDFVRELMARMRLDANQRSRATRAFNAGRRRHFRAEPALVRLRAAALGQPDLAEGFLSLLVAISGVDGDTGPAAQKLLRKAAMLLGPGTGRLDEMLGRRAARPAGDLGRAYEILGVAAGASDREVKLAYRRLMHRHHPDRLEVNAPRERVEVAVRRTVEIRRAYERVVDERKPD